MIRNELVSYEVHEWVALITIRRPEKRNAINTWVALDLQAAWERLEAREGRVLVIAGERGPTSCI